MRGSAHRPAGGEYALSGNGSHKHEGVKDAYDSSRRACLRLESFGRPQRGCGNGFTYPCSIALASQGVAYVVNRGGEGNQGSRVSKVYIGAPGAEQCLGNSAAAAPARGRVCAWRWTSRGMPTFPMIG